MTICFSLEVLVPPSNDSDDNNTATNNDEILDGLNASIMLPPADRLQNGETKADEAFLAHADAVRISRCPQQELPKMENVKGDSKNSKASSLTRFAAIFVPATLVESALKMSSDIESIDDSNKKKDRSEDEFTPTTLINNNDAGVTSSLSSPQNFSRSVSRSSSMIRHHTVTEKTCQFLLSSIHSHLSQKRFPVRFILCLRNERHAPADLVVIMILIIKPQLTLHGWTRPRDQKWSSDEDQF